MNQDEFKKLLDEALTPIRQDLQEVKNTQKEQTETLGALQASVVTIETEIKTYADMYKVNNSNGKKLEKRIEVLEDKAEVIPPPELTLADVK